MCGEEVLNPVISRPASLVVAITRSLLLFTLLMMFAGLALGRIALLWLNKLVRFCCLSTLRADSILGWRASNCLRLHLPSHRVRLGAQILHAPSLSLSVVLNSLYGSYLHLSEVASPFPWLASYSDPSILLSSIMPLVFFQAGFCREV